MSIAAYTYEELTIHNVNEKTAQLAGAVGNYLLETWGIVSIMLTVNGVDYDLTDIDCINEGSALHGVCAELASAKEIMLCMRSCNSGGTYWRLDSCFMQYLTDDCDIKQNVTYRSTDYYDTDPGVEMYLYNENGLQCPEYTDNAKAVADICEWFCYTPTLRIADEEQMKNAALHERLMAIVKKLCKLFGLTEGDMEDRLEDDWEGYGEIILNGSVRFSNQDIPAITELANQLIALTDGYESAEVEFEIYAVPDGEDDYNFASVAIALDGETVTDKYCRF